MGADFQQGSVTLQDGVAMAYRDYGPRDAGTETVLCLPGLTRNARDFHGIASVMSETRRVIAPDLRGRGLSDWAASYKSYTVAQETQDVLQLLAALGLNEVVFVGTSRGGLITMNMAAQRPTVIKAAILNDIGPKVGLKGLIRIFGYVGRTKAPATWADAVAAMRKINEASFPGLSDSEWEDFAHNLIEEKDGKLELMYDPAIGKATRRFTGMRDIPGAWTLFAAMSAIPTLVIRGELSDILEAKTVDKMKAQKPDLEVCTVPDRGHAPMLTESAAQSAILSFLQTIDG